MAVCDFLSRVTLLGVDFEVRAGFLMRSDINLKNPARSAQTCAADQKPTHQQPYNHPKRTNELVCTCAALRVPTNAPRLPLGSSRARKCRHKPPKARTPRTNTRCSPRKATLAALQTPLTHQCTHFAYEFFPKYPQTYLVCRGALVRVHLPSIRHMRKKSLHAAQKQRRSQETPPQQPTNTQTHIYYRLYMRCSLRARKNAPRLLLGEAPARTYVEKPPKAARRSQTRAAAEETPPQQPYKLL